MTSKQTNQEINEKVELDQTDINVAKANQDEDENDVKRKSIKWFKKFFNFFANTALIEDSESKISDNKQTNLIEEIETLKNNTKAQKIPENTLQRYFYLLAEARKRTDYSDLMIDYDYVDSILDRIDINYENEYGDSALHEACKIIDYDLYNEKKQTETYLIDLLIGNGADIYLVNRNGQSVLHIAAAYNNTTLLKYFLAEDKKNKHVLLNKLTHGENQTPMHYAAKNDCVDAIVCLFENTENRESILEARDYQGRTPLYLAGEYANSTCVKKLIDLGAKLDVSNIYGQKAVFWICSKCSDIALDILDNYREADIFLRKNCFRLNNLDLEVYVNEKGKKKIPKAKTILMYIAENKRLDLIAHPVIEALIDAKWLDFARARCLVDMLQVIVDLVVWNLIGVLVPYDKKHIYTFPQDWWRIFLWVLAFLGVLWSIGFEIAEIINISRYQSMARKQRIKELEDDESFCHPKDFSQKLFLRREKIMAKQKNAFLLYLEDPWNWFDILSILMILVVFATHVADVIYHSETLARIHIRIFSITIIFIGIRIFEIGRVINSKFGMLVVSLSFLVQKIFVWLVLYFILEISFTSAIWMIYGYDQTKSTGLTSYYRVIFLLWLKTFGRQLNQANMNEVDPRMTSILCGLLTGILALLMFNIFIALLTSTMELVMGSAKAYFLLQRVLRIIVLEHELPIKMRIQHLNKLKSKYKTDFTTETEELETENQTKETISTFQSEMEEVKGKIEEIKLSMNKSVEEIYKEEEKVKNEIRTKSKKSILNSNEKINKVIPSEQRVKKLSDDIARFKSFIESKIMAQET